MKIISVLALSIAILSCNRKSGSEFNFINISKSTLSDLGNLDKYIDIKEIIVLETTPNSLIGKVDKLIHYNNEFFILDADYRKNILRFDSSGKFLGLIVSEEDKQINKFLNIKDFDIHNGNIYFIDYFNPFIFSKHLATGIVSKLSIPESKLNIAAIDENRFFMYSGYGSTDAENNRLSLIYSKGFEYKILNQYLPSDSILSYAMNGTASLRFLKYKDNYLIHEYGNDTIYSIFEKNTKIKYILNFEDNTIKDYLYNKEYQSAETHQHFVDKNNISHKMFEVFLLDNLLSIDYYWQRGQRQLIYDMAADTIIANCNYYIHKNKKLPISFYWFPYENNQKQVISFFTSENLAEMDKATQAIFQQNMGKPINENNNPILVILEKK